MKFTRHAVVAIVCIVAVAIAIVTSFYCICDTVGGGWRGIPEGVNELSDFETIPEGIEAIRIICPDDDILTKASEYKRLSYVMISQDCGQSASLQGQSLQPRCFSTTGFGAIIALPNLSVLDVRLAHDLDDDCLAMVSSSPSLREIRLFDCKSFTASGLHSLCTARSLREFAAYGHELNLEEIRALSTCTQLENIVIELSPSAAREVLVLRSLPRLIHLTIYGSNVTKEAAAELREALPQCEIILEGLD